MTTFIISGLLITTILAIATYLTIWSRRPTNARLLSIVLLVPLSLMAFGAIGINLGNPSICWSGYNIPTGKLDVLGFKVIKNDRIFLTLDTGRREPFTCSIPYSNSNAEGLEGAKRAGTKSKFEGKGTGGSGSGLMEPDGIILPDAVPPLPDKPSDTDQSISL